MMQMRESEPWEGSISLPSQLGLAVTRAAGPMAAAWQVTAQLQALLDSHQSQSRGSTCGRVAAVAASSSAFQAPQPKVPWPQGCHLLGSRSPHERWLTQQQGSRGMMGKESTRRFPCKCALWQKNMH